MRDLSAKIDGSSTLSGAEFDSFNVELENAVTSTGQTLDSAAGPDTDQQQLARALVLAAQGGASYDDSGAANTFVLAAKRSALVQPESYLDGMTVSFRAAATNTGGCTINVEGLGAISFTRAGGTAFTAGQIVTGNFIVAQYDASENRFEVISNTTPEASGPLSPDQMAVYSDAGSATGFTLTIEPGYVQPTAFTDQMVVIFRANATNNGTGTHQANITNGLGSRDVVEADGTNPTAGRIPAGSWVVLVFVESRNAFEIVLVSSIPQPGDLVPVVSGSSSGTLYNLDLLPQTLAPLAYFEGFSVMFRAPQSNTGSLDINVGGLGARDLRRFDGANFVSGEIATGSIVIAQYILSEDRFRGVAIGPQATILDLQSGRAARSGGLIDTNIPANAAFTLNWQAPTFDDLGFYNAAQDRFEIPAVEGISRVDINVTLNVNLGLGEDVGFILSQNGTAIAGGSIVQGASNNFLTISVQDLPVSDGDNFEVQADLDGSTTRTVAFASMSIRASRFN